jgi:type IV secretory pathway TrbD component
MHPNTRRRIARWGLRISAAVLLAALPFALLVRGALVASSSFGWHAWLAVAFGALLSVLAVSAVVWSALRRVSMRPSFRSVATRVALPLVVLFCCFSLLYLSGSNAKSAGIREAYPRLHPILRLAVGTVRLVDTRIVVTDIERGPTSYAAMRLPRPTGSLHYRQKDGTVHAIDLRTEGRGVLRNGLVRLYFELLGFETVRHVGTADHLHVCLPEV